MKKLFTYENGTVTLMALIFGCLFFDRLALNFIMPFVASDLNLTNTQIGLLAAGLSFTWAFSSYFTTAWSEANNKNKLIFISSVFVFSICSFISGLAVGFISLLIARLIMGFAEGPVIPLAQAFVERESTPKRLGLNVGILQAIGSALFGSILAPVLLVKMAENLGWRSAFYIAGLPGLLLGIIAWFYLKPSTTESKNAEEDRDTAIIVADLLKYNNIKWGIPVACCVFGWWFATLPFISKYFTDVQGMDAAQMGKTMGILGLAGLVSSIIIPGISDKVGRKKALLIALILGLFYPISVFYFNSSLLHMPLMFITYFMMGAIPIVAAAIPSETVPDHLKAKAIGLITGVAEIVGGVIVPAVAGALSDATSDSAFLWVSTVLAALAILFSLKLNETKVIQK